jgi:hypothetical protein
MDQSRIVQWLVVVEAAAVGTWGRMFQAGLVGSPGVGDAASQGYVTQAAVIDRQIAPHRRLRSVEV